MEPAIPQSSRRSPADAAWSLLIAAVVLLGLLFASDRPQADDSATNGVKEVVQLQLLAFQADDAAKAFQLADPGIRSKFASAEEFLEMGGRSTPWSTGPRA